MIAIISPSELPIPAVRGGAVETGIQQIIDENEYGKEEIIVFSYYDEQASEISKKYKNTKFIYFKSQKLDNILKNIIKTINFILRKLHIKIQFNFQIRYLDFIIKKINENKIEKVLLKNSTRFVIKLRKKCNVKVFLQLHNDFLNSDTYNCKKIAENSYKLIANSEYIKKRILTIEGIEEKKVEINKNCLNLEDYKIREADIKKIIEKYNICTDKNVLLFSGRIVPQKGIKELLLSLEKIKEENWVLYILGSKWFGKNQTDKFGKEIQKIIEKFNEDKIIMIGYVPHNEIAIWNKIADIVIVPSIWEEPAGRTVLEAQAAGTPVITTYSGGIPEYISDESGIIIKKDIFLIENLSKNIKNLLENNKERILMGKKGVELAKNYGSKRYYREIINILEK